MAIVKRLSSKSNVRWIEAYLKQIEKTDESLISAMNCDSDNFAKQCRITNDFYNKNQKKYDRQYYHIIQSFSPEDNVSPERAQELAERFAEEHFKGFEVLIVTHKDKGHIHNHFVVNSVSFETGKKYRASNQSLFNMRKSSNNFCGEYGFTNSIIPLDKRAKDKVHSGELRTVVAGRYSWKQELKAQIIEVSKNCKSADEFKTVMKEKYNVEVTERSRISKRNKETIYQYQTKGHEKPCGEHRLGEDYGKESLENGFIGRSKEVTRATDKGIDTQRFSTGDREIKSRTIREDNNRTAELIRNSRATIDNSRTAIDNSTTERANREAERERLATERSNQNRAREPKERARERTIDESSHDRD